MLESLDDDADVCRSVLIMAPDTTAPDAQILIILMMLVIATTVAIQMMNMMLREKILLLNDHEFNIVFSFKYMHSSIFFQRSLKLGGH